MSTVYNIQTRSLACAAGWRILCPPEAPGVTLINYKGVTSLNTSVLLLQAEA